MKDAVEPDMDSAVTVGFFCTAGGFGGDGSVDRSVAFILSGMTASGLVPLSRALIVLACAIMGSSLLVFMAAVDLQLPILLLIGFCGLLLAFRIFTRWKPAA
jgi:hypothetical protein